MKTKILVIEDEAVIAQDISDILTTLEYDVVKIIHSSEKAIDYLSFHTPDLILCDINIKGARDGIQVAEVINKTKRIPFVFLTSFADRNTLGRAKRVLPYGYIVKPFDEKDLLSAIEVALFKFNQELEALKISKEKIDHIIESHLTDKEYEILKQLVEGLNYQEITSKQNISNNTLKYHIKNIFTKFEVSNKAEVLQKILMSYVK